VRASSCMCGAAGQGRHTYRQLRAGASLSLAGCTEENSEQLATATYGGSTRASGQAPLSPSPLSSRTDTDLPVVVVASAAGRTDDRSSFQLVRIAYTSTERRGQSLERLVVSLFAY
jgi:hypothetical protein